MTTDDIAQLTEDLKEHNRRRLLLEAAAPELLETAAPIAACVFAYEGDDSDLISVTAGELRALAAAVAKAKGT